jgi:hypothetical protein
MGGARPLGRENGITVIDAAASEQVGCTADEFYDEDHYDQACAAKVFARYWQDRPPAGRYTP